MTPGLISWSGGNPFWNGLPSQERICVIHSLTYVDTRGRIFYRLTPNGPFRRLRSDGDYQALNSAVDQWGPKV